MRTYLEEFFKIFAFEKEDIKHLLDCYDHIQAHPQAKALWDKALSIYEFEMICDFKLMIDLGMKATQIAGYHFYTGNLLLFCCLSQQLQHYYVNNGIDLKIYYDTLLDLRYKLEECKTVKGICGLFVPTWFVGFYTLKRFALGRLQFEIIPFGLDYVKDGYSLTQQHKVINIHIPRTGTPIDQRSCDIAFLRAKEFFAGQWSNPCTFYCNSWLLFPAHEEIISHHTNTYKFMKRFEIVKETVDHEGKNLWRLFDTDEKNPRRLPADTSMRRSYIHYLTQGKHPGCGIGIFFL